MFRKLMITLLALTLIFGISAFDEPEALASSGPELSISSAEAVPGGELRVDVNLDKNPGICALELYFDFDRDRLTLVSMEEDKDFGGMWSLNAEGGKAVFVNFGSDTDITGRMLTLKFKASEDFRSGGTEVSVSGFAGNWDEERLELHSTPGTVSIGCSHAHTEIRGRKDATRTEKGYTGDEVCTDCGKVIKKGSEIPALSDNAGGDRKPAGGSGDSQSRHNCAKDGHDWGSPVYEWNGEHCTARRVCRFDPSHTETAEAEVSGKIIREPGADGKAGEKELTAVFSRDWARTQTKTVSFGGAGEESGPEDVEAPSAVEPSEAGADEAAVNASEEPGEDGKSVSYAVPLIALAVLLAAAAAVVIIRKKKK